MDRLSGRRLREVVECEWLRLHPHVVSLTCTLMGAHTHGRAHSWACTHLQVHLQSSVLGPSLLAVVPQTSVLIQDQVSVGAVLLTVLTLVVAPDAAV